MIIMNNEEFELLLQKASLGCCSKEDLLDAIEEKVENTYKFEIKDHDLKFYGLCSKCK